MTPYDIIINSMREARQRLDGKADDMKILACAQQALEDCAHYNKRKEERIRNAIDKLKIISSKLPSSTTQWLRQGIREVIQELR